MLKRTNVLVKRNSDNVQMVMPYKTFRDMRDSKAQESYSMGGGISEFNKLSLIGECNGDGNPIEGNPNLLEIDKTAAVEA